MGNKSKNLEILKANKFRVPEFISFKSGDNFEEKIKNLDENKKYAVRSDMNCEDSKNSSFAGQFQTFINVEFNKISESIDLVIKDAKSKKLENNEIGVIIQEYIEFEYSGIAFSRNPNGGYEMNVEYHKGIGEDIVSGNITPKIVKLYHWEKYQQGVSTPCSQKFIENIKKIEKIFNFPQDIEWGSANGKIYFLQSRNITTISKQKYKEIKYIDDFVKKEKSATLSFGLKGEMPEGQSGYVKSSPFFYEKTEISEILPKVTDFSYDLIQKVYAKNGPVYNFYKKNGVKIETNNFLKVIGNELFVDKQVELQNLFTNLTLFKNKYKKKFIFNSKIFITINNFIKLNFIKFNKKNILDEIEKQINNLNKNFKNSPIIPFNKGDEHSVINFLKNYETIFEINFFTQKYFSTIEIFQKKLNINILDFLDSTLVKEDKLLKIKNSLEKIDYSQIVGNSFDIEDNSNFSTNIFNKTKKETSESFEKLALWKQNFIKQKINDLQFFSDLREIGRILTVLNVNILSGKSYIIPFYKGDENKSFSFENKISDTFIEEEKNKKINILSNFDAKGKLVDLDYLDKNYDKNKKYILFTKNLNPNLVQYFDKIEGIISEKGGVLSHLSIMCREYQKMLLVCNLEKENIKIGDEIYFKDGKISNVRSK